MRRDETQNPYQDVNGIHDLSMFFGRTATLRRLYSAIASKQCLSLVGPRRIGKSALLAYMTLTDDTKPFGCDVRSRLFVWLDMRNYRHTTSTTFFKEVSEDIVATYQKRMGRWLFALETKKGAERFKFVLQEITNAGLHPVLLMDAFDNIIRNEHFDSDFFSFLRAQASNIQVSYITASIAQLDGICRHDLKDSPFFNIFSLEKLGPLTHEDAHALVAIPAEQAGCPFDIEEQKWILSLAGRHPFFLQRLCHFLFEEKCMSETVDIDFRQVEERVYAELRQHFAILWADLESQEQQAIEQEVSQGVPMKQSKPELSESRLFRRFVYENRSISISQTTQQLTAESFEDILASLDDSDKLGRSHLSNLKIVTARLPRSTEHSASEIGRVVREVLKEALERLRGSDDTTRNEADWLSYSILELRYFKRSHYKMSSPQIASYLGYSDRSYFRERSKAVQILLETVIEMEKALP